MNRGRDALLADKEWGATFREIEEIAGGRLCSATQQERWRPAWFCDLERGGERFSVYYRGDRGVQDDGVADAAPRDGGAAHARGERHPGVARVRLLRDEARDRDGDLTRPRQPRHRRERRRAPRRARRISRPPRRYPRARPGIVREAGHAAPATAEERSLADMPRWESAVPPCKNQPEPVIELALALAARERAGAPRARVVSCRRLRAVPVRPRSRHRDPRRRARDDRRSARRHRRAALARSLEPLGDLSRGIARYRERTGDDFETRDVLYQAVRFAIFTPMATCWLCARRRRD